MTEEVKAPASPKTRKTKAAPKAAPETVQGGEVKAYRKRVVSDNGSVIVYL